MSKRDTHQGQVPTLSPLFGGPDKKPRFLDKDVVTVGRARGCDITLDANEVSAIHCIFYRAATGYRIRDCGSRTGTRTHALSGRSPSRRQRTRFATARVFVSGASSCGDIRCDVARSSTPMRRRDTLP